MFPRNRVHHHALSHLKHILSFRRSSLISKEWTLARNRNGIIGMLAIAFSIASTPFHFPLFFLYVHHFLLPFVCCSLQADVHIRCITPSIVLKLWFIIAVFRAKASFMLIGLVWLYTTHLKQVKFGSELILRQKITGFSPGA